MNTPTKEEFIAAAARSGIQFEDLIHAENEIAAAEKVSFSSPSSAGFKCPPLASKIVKHHGRPWKGSLSEPRISPPKTPGDAMIKNSCTRLRGGQLIPRLLKMALPSTIHNSNKVKSIHSSRNREDEERNRAPNHGGQSSGGNSNARRPFNPARNGQLRYNPGHNSGRSYGGYARGWQRQHHPGYKFASSHVHTDRARLGQPVEQHTQRSSQPQRQAVKGVIIHSKIRRLTQRNRLCHKCSRIRRLEKQKLTKGSSGGR
jgi:hypothetical protein